MLYVRLKGVSLVLDLEVVRYDQSTVGSSSTHAPLDLIRRLLRLLTIILFGAYFWPLVCGCATMVNRRWIRFSSHNSLKGMPSNWVPISLTSTLRFQNM